MMSKSLIATFVAALSLTSPAEAATIVQSFTLQHVAVPAGITIQGPGSPLAQFDPSLGTLQSVTLSVDNQVYFYPNPTTNSNSTFASISLGGHFTNIIQVGGIQLSFTYDPLVNLTLNPWQFEMIGIGGNQSADTTITSGFGALVGTGTVTPLSLMYGMITTYTADPGVQMLLAPNTQYASEATLTYTYDDGTGPAVPEPSSWMLMIDGLAFVGGAMRRVAGGSRPALAVAAARV